MEENFDRAKFFSVRTMEVFETSPAERINFRLFRRGKFQRKKLWISLPNCNMSIKNDIKVSQDSWKPWKNNIILYKYVARRNSEMTRDPNHFRFFSINHWLVPQVSIFTNEEANPRVKFSNVSDSEKNESYLNMFQNCTDERHRFNEANLSRIFLQIGHFSNPIHA